MLNKFAVVLNNRVSSKKFNSHGLLQSNSDVDLAQSIDLIKLHFHLLEQDFIKKQATISGAVAAPTFSQAVSKDERAPVGSQHDKVKVPVLTNICI